MKNRSQLSQGKNPPHVVHLIFRVPRDRSPLMLISIKPLPRHRAHARWIAMRFPNSIAAIANGATPAMNPQYSCHCATSSVVVVDGNKSMESARTTGTPAIDRVEWTEDDDDGCRRRRLARANASLDAKCMTPDVARALVVVERMLVDERAME